MLKPYAYLSTGKSADVQREAPTGARVALHYPELGRTVELMTDAEGRYSLTDRAAPGHGGPTITVAAGQLADGEPGTYGLDLARHMREAADQLARVQAGGDVGASSDTARLIANLRALASNMDRQA